MRIVSGILCILMILFTAVQFNDPDAASWIAIYGLGALICGAFTLRPALFSEGPGFMFLSLCVLATLLGVFWYWPTTDGWWKSEVWWETETAREGMGMMIVLVFLFIIWLFARRFSKIA